MISYIKLFVLTNLFYLNICYKYDIKYLLNNIINETNITITSNVTNTLKLKNNTEVIPPYLQRKSKFCHIKCNCFFSHNVVNDNINVNNCIRTPGLPFSSMNDNICVSKYI
jgi:hypothetical protein